MPAPPPSRPGFRAGPVLHLVVIGVLVLASYSNTFHAPFHFDDPEEITDNTIVHDLRYFAHPSAAKELPAYYGLKMRYVGYLSFALNYAFHGSSVFGYHAVNVAIHIINAFLLYSLVALSFRTPALQGSSLGASSPLVALFSALLFGCHPVQTQAVTYIVQRIASLAAMFCLLSLVAYGKSRLATLEGRSAGAASAWYAASLLSAAAAMKTKEIAFTLPLVIGVYEFLFFQGRWNTRALRLLPLFLTMLIIPLGLVLGDGSPGGLMARIGGATRVQSALTRGEYLLTQFRVAVTYIRLLFLPVRQNLDYDYPVYRSFFDPAVASSFLALFLLGGAAVFLYCRKRRSRPAVTLIAFGIFWFFAALSVESSVLPIADVMFEHRMYLPSAGALTAAVVSAFSAGERLRKKGRGSGKALVGALVVVAVVFAAATHARNAVWRDGVTLWSDVVAKSPGKPRGYLNLGIAYDQEGRYDEAIGAYRKANSLDPGDADVLFNMAIAYAAKGMTDEAIRFYQAALRIRPAMAKAHFNLGVSYLAKGAGEEAREEFASALRIAPGFSQARRFLDYLGGGR